MGFGPVWRSCCGGDESDDVVGASCPFVEATCSLDCEPVCRGWDEVRRDNGVGGGGAFVFGGG